MRTRATILALALAGSVVGSATAQVPTLQVFSDSSLKEPFIRCGTPNTWAELFVVMRNVNFLVSAIDFSISYSPYMVWLYDMLPDPDVMVQIGNSPMGTALAWAGCCTPDGSLGDIVVLRPVIYWPGYCRCGDSVVRVEGYAPLGKTTPSVVRYPDFTEFDIIGMDTYFCPPIPVQPTTWGSVKALYR